MEFKILRDMRKSNSQVKLVGRITWPTDLKEAGWAGWPSTTVSSKNNNCPFQCAKSSSTGSQLAWIGNFWVSSNAKETCTEIGSNVGLPKNIVKIFLGHSVVKLGKPKLSCQEEQKNQLRTYCYLRRLSVDPLLNGAENLMTEYKKRMRNML